MTLADAIRSARQPEEVVPQAPEVPVEEPRPPSPEVSGGVVRLEIFMGPEQLTGLVRAVAQGQRSVLTLREAAAHLRVSGASLERMAEAGETPGVRVDGRWRFSRAALDRWIEDREEADG